MAVGIDIGTCYLVAARQDANQEIKIKSIRDAFLDLDNEEQTKAMLKMSKIDYIEADDKIYIVGEPAVIMANIFKKESRRPLQKGVISAGELEAEKILSILLQSVLGKSTSKAPETCYYSVPAAPIDMDMDVVYHGAMFSKLLGNRGYRPVSLNEGAAICYSNAAPENFSACALSFGSGMVNICLMYKTLIGMAFSLSRGGDHIDISAARSTGTTASRTQAIKEKGIDLMDPAKGDPKTLREREAIVIYYKSLVLYALDSIKNEFLKRQSTMDLPEAIPIILSGGTALAGNFLEFFKQAFETVKSKWPFEVSEIRLASDPLNATSQGLLVAAMNHDEGAQETVTPEPKPEPKPAPAPEGGNV